MARPKKKFRTKAERDKHELVLERRRREYRHKRTVEMASQAAEGQSDFVELVAAEKARISGHAKALHVKGSASSPKVTISARDNLAQAFDLMGGVPALVVWGRENPTDFYRIWARLIPKEAVETTTTLPLEDLLSKLASREEQSVGEAALAIGQEVLDQGKAAAEAEDAELASKSVH